MMSDEALKAALAGVRLRIPQTREDAEALRAEVRAADVALGARLRAAAAERRERSAHDSKGGER